MPPRTRRLDVEIGAEAKGDGFRETERRAERLQDKLRKVSKRSGEDSGDDFAKGFDSKLGAKLKGIGSKLSAHLDKVGAAAGAAFASSLAGQAFSSLAAGLQTAGAGAAAGLALIPAAAGAGALAMGTLKVATLGVADALSAGLTGDTEAFAEALEGLSPAAQGFAREVVGLRDGLDGLRSTVQDNFFGEFAGQAAALGSTFLPLVETAMGRVATGFGRAVDQATGFLLLPDTVQMLKGALGSASIAVNNVSAGVANLVAAFVPLVVVGAGFLPQLTAGFANATAGLAALSNEAMRSGVLVTFIHDGLEGLRGMWGTAKQLAGIFVDIGAIGATVFGAAGLSGGASGLLDTISDLTGKARDFVESARGAEVLEEIFTVIGDAVENFRQPIERAFGILVDVIGPLLPDLKELWTQFSELKNVVLNIGLDALEPVLHGIGAVLGAVVLPALTGTIGFLADNKPLLQGIAIAIGTLLVPAFAAWAISAGTAAAATIAATLPIILIGAAIALLAALVITHFDTIKRWISNVFNWVKDNWPLLLAILTGPFGLAVLAIVRNWQTIKDGASAVKDWVVDRFGDLLDFVKGLPGKISDAASGMWDGISDAFKSALNALIGLWNRLRIPGFDIHINGPGPIPDLDFSWDGLSLPNIPTLHEGGTFRAPRPGGEGLAMLMDGEVVSQPGEAGGDTYITEVHVHGSLIHESELDDRIVTGLKRSGANGVPITIAGRRL